MTDTDSNVVPRNPLGFAKLAPPYLRFVLPFFLSIIMTCVVSFISTLRSAGLTNGFWVLWLGSWGISWLFAYPTMVLVLPSVRRIAGAFVRSE
ncbi:MAG: DUF2798 domain-containing protein [Rhodoferax sp.]|nr:DUF2798 domain-containing protein [Rhodoferax sp.]